MGGILLETGNVNQFSTRTRAIVKLHHQCNNRCLFCHAADQAEAPGSLERILVKLDRLPAGVDQVLLSGGEPTIFPDLPPLLEHLRRRSLATGFISNGRMFSYPDFVRRVLSLNADYFYISLHAAEPACHDRITGCPGSWEQTTRGIRNLLAAAVPIDLTVNCVVNRLNVDALFPLVEFAAANRIDRLKFSIPEVKGLAAVDSCSKLVPLDYAGRQVSLAMQKGSRLGVHCSYDGLPCCLVARTYRDRRGDLQAHRIFYVSEVSEDAFFPTDDGQRKQLSGCRACSWQGVCAGPYTGYDAFDDSRVRSIRTPVPNAFTLEPRQHLMSACACLAECGMFPPGLGDMRLVLRDRGLLTLHEANSDFFKRKQFAQAKRNRQLYQRDASVDDLHVKALRPLRPQPRCAACVREDCPGIYEVNPCGSFLALSPAALGRLARLSGDVLDIGSGAVQLSGILFPETGGPATYTGIEPDSDACSAARKKFPRATFLNTTLERTVLPKQTYDHVLMLGSYAHIRNLQTASRVIRLSLKDSGELVILQDVVFGMMKDTDAATSERGHPEHFRNDGLREAALRLQEMGFEIVVSEDLSAAGNFWMLVCRKRPRQHARSSASPNRCK